MTMEQIDEPIKNLLESTGWTLGDLLGKLQKLQKTDEGGGLSREEKKTDENSKNSTNDGVANKILLENNQDKIEDEKIEIENGLDKNAECNTEVNNIKRLNSKTTIEKYSSIQKLKVFRKLKNKIKKNARPIYYTSKIVKKYKKLGVNTKKKIRQSFKRQVNNIDQQPKQNIRDKIKEQLELLRHKKKAPLSVPKPVFNVQQSSKKRSGLKISELLLEKFCDSTNDSTESNGNNTLPPTKPILSPDNETQKDNILPEKSQDSRLAPNELFESSSNDFIITNVMGGYKSPEETLFNFNSFENGKMNNKDDEYTVFPIQQDGKKKTIVSEDCLSVFSDRLLQEPIWPTKTNDVTKIKGWQKKKFILPEPTKKEVNSSNLEVVLTNSSIPSTSLNETTYAQKNLEEPDQPSMCFKTKEKKPSDSKSVFISDSLDQYLNENSKLNISYEVPKLIAEDGVTQLPLELPVMYLEKEKMQESESNSSMVKIKADHYKPKTLAEKRKIMAGEFDQKIKEKRKHSTEDSEMKLFEVQRVLRNPLPPRVKYKESAVILTPSSSFTKLQFRRAQNKKEYCRTFVYNRKRLKVVSSGSRKVIGKIIDDNTIEQPKQYISLAEKMRLTTQNTKPSLLKALSETKVENITYKPGPLCHKVKLQNNLKRKWKTSIFKLPKVFVEIEPILGKPVHPRIRELIKRDDDFVLDKSRIDFALSALVSSPVKPLMKFPISYANNQKSMMVRRRVPIEEDEKDIIVPVISLNDEQKTAEEIVKNVVDRMLDYVETKEIDQNIRVDPDLLETSSESLGNGPPPSPIGMNVSTIIKKTSYCRKKSKTAMELKRLNVKIIEVDVEDPENDAQCNKEYCRMGCVCSSLLCNPSFLIQEHCGLEKCMLNCSCKVRKDDKENKLTLPVGTNILSAHVVNHLQDVAKKDLAKVEKEFTQTVIKANNQTIVVGTDPKERLRRVTKVPKRYNDFVQEEAAIAEKFSEYKVPEVIFKDVIVNLKRYKFDIIPFCMVHELYNCQCSCSAVFPPDDPQPTVVKPIKPKPASEVSKIEVSKEESESEAVDVCNLSKVVHPDRAFCCRTKGLATDYYLERNRSLPYKQKLHRLSRKLEILRNKHFHNKQDTTASKTKVQSPIRKNKRKQTFTELRDFDIAERRQMLLKTNTFTSPFLNFGDFDNNNDLFTGQSSLTLFSHQPRLTNKPNNSEVGKKKSRKYPQVTPKPIEHDLLQDLRTNKADLGKNLCLMSWKTLRTKYQNSTIFIWQSRSAFEPEILITSRPSIPAPGFINVRTLSKISKYYINANHIVRWLTTGLPFEKMEDNLLVILSMGDKSCKVCGVCEKLENSNKYRLIETNSKDIYSASTESPTPLQIDLTKEENKSCVSNDPKKSTTENRKRVLFFSRHKYEKLSLTSEKQMHLPKEQQIPVKANLPFIEGGCRWRLIELGTAFTYLYFVRSNYSIRFVDLLKAPNMVSDPNVSINLKSSEMRKNYHHPRFGIFCMPKSRSEVFVGPYGVDEEHDLEILTYINKVLVNTDLYNQVKGKPDLKNGAWYYQADDSPLKEKEEDSNDENDDVQIIQEQPTCIDLTAAVSDNEEAPSVKNEPLEDDQHIKKEKDAEESIKLTTWADFNYNWRIYPLKRAVIVTNVGNLGCIKVLQSSAEEEVKILCPFSNTVRIFPKLETAVNVVEKELNEALTPIPANFVLKCTVKKPAIGLDLPKQIDRNVLQGDHIIGEFGVRHLKEAAALYIRQFVKQDQESNSVFMHENKESFEKYKAFAYELLQIPSIQRCKDTASIIRLAIKEILELQFMEKKYKDEKIVQELKKAELVEKYSRLVKKGEKPIVTCTLESASSSEKNTVNQKDVFKPRINLLESEDEFEKPQNSSSKSDGLVGKKLKLVSKNDSTSAVFKSFSSNDSSEDKQGVALPVKGFLKIPPGTKNLCLFPPKSKRLREKMLKNMEENNKTINTEVSKRKKVSLRERKKAANKANKLVISVQPTLRFFNLLPNAEGKLSKSRTDGGSVPPPPLVPTTVVTNNPNPSNVHFVKIAPRIPPLKLPVPVQLFNSADQKNTISKVIPVKVQFPGTSILKPSPRSNSKTN